MSTAPTKSAAVTTLDPVYPPYINCTRNDDGSVRVIIRGTPSEVDGVAVCGQDCRPGSDRCNNYCNQAPDKGAMAQRPPAMRHIKCGETVSLTLSADEFATLCAALGKI